MNMRNIVLDTNSLIIAISAKNDCHKVWQSFLNGDYTLCISNEILEEYLEVITRNINKYHHGSPERERMVCGNADEAIIYTILTRENVKRLTPHYRFHLITADQDDNKFVDCAIAANAEYIVTEDHHFNELKNISFPAVAIINLKDFAKTL